MAIISISAEHGGPVASPMPHRKKLFHLQALRGLAASLVVFAHSADILNQYGQIPESYAGRLAISGYFGIATFFIISGFIIYKTSAKSFGDRQATAAFAIKRVIRIFPVYWLAIIIFLAVTSHRNEFGPIDILYLTPAYPARHPNGRQHAPTRRPGLDSAMRDAVLPDLCSWSVADPPHRHASGRGNPDRPRLRRRGDHAAIQHV